MKGTEFGVIFLILVFLFSCSRPEETYQIGSFFSSSRVLSEQEIDHIKNAGPNGPACPLCKAKGQRSRTAFESAGMSTSMAGQYVWFDENENPHYCDHNLVADWYRCSKGHSFLYTYPSDCP